MVSLTFITLLTLVLINQPTTSPYLFFCAILGTVVIEKPSTEVTLTTFATS